MRELREKFEEEAKRFTLLGDFPSLTSDIEATSIVVGSRVQHTTKVADPAGLID